VEHQALTPRGRGILPGTVHNPLGAGAAAKKKLKAIRDLLAGDAPRFVKKLIKLTESKNEYIALAACRDALDRIYGKAHQAIALTDGAGAPLKLVLELSQAINSIQQDPIDVTASATAPANIDGSMLSIEQKDAAHDTARAEGE